MSIALLIIIALGCLALVDLIRAILGPTAVDRMVASSAITTKGLAIILLLAVADSNLAYIDVALVLALCGFVGLLALLRSLLPADADHLVKEIAERPAQLVRYASREESK